jgi:hypothetical protein
MKNFLFPHKKEKQFKLKSKGKMPCAYLNGRWRRRIKRHAFLTSETHNSGQLPS